MTIEDPGVVNEWAKNPCARLDSQSFPHLSSCHLLLERNLGLVQLLRLSGYGAPKPLGHHGNRVHLHSGLLYLPSSRQVRNFVLGVCVLLLLVIVG